MSRDLAQWEERLEGHFRHLAAARRQVEGGPPLFALEHNLEAEEIGDLGAAIRAHIGHNPPQREHVLTWVVYAAELGYRYSGDEFWQTFERETPGWTVYGDRHWIRQRYRSFRQQYGGAEPSGAWAEHFSIICWPITHAILPWDLQRQLARILYELRHAFSSELLESPINLGESIQGRSWNATSRFQNLAQDVALVGQIATALLFEGRFGTDSLIHSSALERISKDLERERRAREWLRSARRSAQERARVRGLAVSWGMPSPSAEGPQEAREDIAALGIEPRLVLRPNDAVGECWGVSLEVPDLSHLLLKLPRTREILTNTRCVVAGASGRPLARGTFLYGSRRVVLARWPRPEEVLLQFEKTDPQLEYILRAECLLRPGPSWLFRIASDGVAYESRSLRVRPGERYILVTSSEVAESIHHVRPISLDCQGVYGVLLTLPSALTPEWEETLRCLGLAQARAIEVWPAGLSAAVWDGEGHGEWLTSERPCLAVRSDHPVDALLVLMDGSPESTLELAPVVPGEPLFFELPSLPTGLHRIRVSARAAPDAVTESLGALDVVMRIRESRPWSPGLSSQGPLRVEVDPITPTLEQLWEGRVRLAIQGPPGRRVRSRVSLLEREEEEAIYVGQLPPLPFPVDPDAWSAQFERHVRKEAGETYDLARICQLEFFAKELGTFTVRCEREFTPLRWAVRRRGQCYTVCLVDDTGEEQGPVVGRLAFEKPCVEERMVSSKSQYEAPEPGGMYVARSARYTVAVIVPPVVRNLSDLGCSPRIDGTTRSLEGLYQLTGMMRLWGKARLTGDLFSATRKRQVLVALLQHLFGVICGETWARAEEAAGRDKARLGAPLEEALSRRRNEAAVAEYLVRDVADLLDSGCEERARLLAELASRLDLLPLPATSFQITAEWLAQFALRLASEPATVEDWAGERIRDGLKGLMDAPALARAARFLVLLTDSHRTARVAAGELYASWGWP